MIEAGRGAALDQGGRRRDDVVDVARRDDAVDEHRRLAAVAQRLDDAVDAAADVAAAEQALDAQHVVPRRLRREPLAEQLRRAVDALRIARRSLSVYGSRGLPSNTKSVL